MEQIWPSSIPSSSNSAIPLPFTEYQVFISFRGFDVRNTFADILYSFLSHSKIHTFLDDAELHKGKEIAPSLDEAIKKSKVYIPILSQNYADSKWCLEELALMVKCCKQESGRLILPIFFFVEPRDVRRQEGAYKEAFEQHVQKYGEETVKIWKEAFHEVGKLKGWPVTKSVRWGNVVSKIVSVVWSHLHESYTLVTDELIGIDSHVEQVVELLNLDSKEVNAVGIHGIGGIGKTTIAMAVYNKVFAQFDRSCFVKDVREMLLKNDGVVDLLNRIVSSILREDCKVKDASEGIQVIKDRVGSRKVFIVLDDVDQQFDFEQILGALSNFSMKSRFIITTRDKRVLDLLPVSRVYEPGMMSHGDSLQLFNRHAFRMDNPSEDEATLSEEFVKVAAGLPLYVKVIGSLLFRRGREFWAAKLIELEKIPPKEVQERLKICYNGLEENEKQIFLDIACFFIGKEKESPSYMWTDCGFSPISGIATLTLRSLIKVDEDNKFWMHDHIRDLGREIVRAEHLHRPWKRSRILSNEDAVNMLTNRKGTKRMQVLIVSMHGLNLELTEKEFKKLSGLRYLSVHSGGLTGDFKNILPNIRWLQLDHCRTLPRNINVKNLVILDMNKNPENDQWGGWSEIKVAHKLKSIDLSYSTGLRRIPDLSQCRSLEKINFKFCTKMSGHLRIGKFKNLRVLKLVNTKITEVIGDVGMLQNLEVIKARDSDLRELPAGIGKLSTLQFLDLPVLEAEVPELPTSLKRLYLSSPGVPNLVDLEDLEELSFSCNKLGIPADMWKLSKLKYLALRDVANGEDNLPPSLQSSLISLSIWGCEPLKRLPNLAVLKTLSELCLSNVAVSEIGGLEELSKLEKLDISKASKLVNLNGLERLLLLETLGLEDCCALETLPSLSNLSKLRGLMIYGCRFLSEIQGLGELQELSTLVISDCQRFVEVAGLEKLELLQALTVNNCISLKKLPDLSHFKHLHDLVVTKCRQLTEVTGIESLERLVWVDVDERLMTRKKRKLKETMH